MTFRLVGVAIAATNGGRPDGKKIVKMQNVKAYPCLSMFNVGIVPWNNAGTLEVATAFQTRRQAIMFASGTKLASFIAASLHNSSEGKID